MSRRHMRVAGAVSAAALLWLSMGGLATARPAPRGTHAHPKSAVSRPVAAWWSSGNLGSGLPALPTSPDVSGHQLLVQGSNAAPALGTSSAPASSQAVAAIRWTLPAHTAATTLRLTIVGTPPAAQSVQACRATSSFHAVYDGAYSSAPTYTCAKPVPATVKGAHLVFPSVGSLARGRHLSVMLLPGALDRIVLAAPTAADLTVRTGSRPPPPSGPAVPTTPTSPPSGTAGRSSAGGVPGGSGTGGSGSGPISVPSLPASAGLGTKSAKSPLVAGRSSPPRIASPTVGAAVVTPAAAWRRYGAGAVIALEVLVFALFQLRGDAVAETGVAPTRGIGRFSREREGRAPSL